MTDETYVRNTVTGETGYVRSKYLTNGILNPDSFVEAEPGSKPYVPELYRSRSAEEFTEDHPVLVTEPEFEDGDDEPQEDEG